MSSFVHWLYGHDIQLDLVTVWALALGFGLLTLIKVASWWALRATRDRTEVGRALKRQKLTEVVIFAALTALYGLTLYGYYEHERFGFWFRFGLRFILIAGVVLAVLFGLRFIRALLRTRATGP